MAILGNQTSSVEESSMQSQAAREEIRLGLTARPRRISSRYFYDARGSEIFRAISELPEYYLTASELEILQTHAQAIAAITADGENLPLAVLEAGPGDARKASLLVRALTERTANTRYAAIDISQTAVNSAVSSMRAALHIEALGFAGDYRELLPQIGRLWPDHRKLLLFLGSSIGNYSSEAAIQLLRTMRESLALGDYALIGFDLKKDESVLLPAYSDKLGLTREFNLNLLRRLNLELNGRFNVNDFEHRAVYNQELGAMQSFLVSTVDQEVRIEDLDLTISLREGETIHTEDSKKYVLAEIQGLAVGAGFKPVQHFVDAAGYFMCSLWQAMPVNDSCS